MLYDQNQLIEKQTGEIMFTDYGLSGICIMQLSRYFDHLKNPKLILNLLPDIVSMILNSTQRGSIFFSLKI